MQWTPVIHIRDADKLEKPVARDLPLARYEGPIRIISDNNTAKTALGEIRRYRDLGFDTESRPAFKKNQRFPVSLIQIAVPDMVYLFQITYIDPAIWTLLLRGRKTVKAAIAVNHDVRQLQQLSSFTGYGLYDLSEAAEKVNLPVFSLRGLCALIFGARISKRQQLSNWSKKDLSTGQISYAATDAWVSLKLYEFFRENTSLKPHSLSMPDTNYKRVKPRRH